MSRPPFDGDPRVWKGPESDAFRSQRQVRFEAAKQVYNELSEEHLDQFRTARTQVPPPSATYPKSREELYERVAEIEKLKEQLAGQRPGFGTGQKGAEEGVEVDRGQILVDELAKADQARVAQERYDAAIEVERHNEGRIAERKRLRRIGTAKRRANRRENQALQKYIQGIPPPEPPKPDQSELEIRAPIRHYPRIARIPAIGEIPVNVEAVAYRERLNNAATSEKKKQKDRRDAVVERTKKAAAHHHCCKMKRDLQDDLNGIHQYELEEQLRPENLRKFASAVPMCSTYLVDEKREQRNEKITLYLSMADAPRPRKQAPQPLSVHQTSPNATDDGS
jgi:hypothetical protein